MNDDINRILNCLTLSVQENEIKNLQSLSWAINKLEQFSMTFDVLDQSRIGQTLQSVRHSKKISVDISERIRYLIKCWRRLLDVNCQSVIPNEIRKSLVSVKPPEINGIIKNGFIKEKISTNINNNINGINHINHSENSIEPIMEISSANNEIEKEKPAEIVSNNIESEIILCDKPATLDYSEQNQIIDSIPEMNTADSSNSQTNQENICQEFHQPNLTEISDENQTFLNNQSKTIVRTQLGKPKLKSTKELLADFSNLIDSDTKNKILLDKITQEDDEPISYHPDEFKLREIIQQNNLYQEKPPKMTLEEEVEEEIDKVIERVTEMKRESKCDKLLKKFQSICGIQPKIVLKPMIPWKNLKRGIDCSSPCIKQSKIKKNYDSTNPDQTKPKYSIADIDELLQTFEIRAQRKDLITAAIQERKETKIIDNTQTISDLSLKLKLKIPQQKIQILKIKKRKKKKKKKKPKLKPKPIARKPRQPKIKPKPPITNFLDDLPEFPKLQENPGELIIDGNLSNDNRGFLNSIENVNKLTYETVEGYNCTKHTQTSELLELTKMYSLLIDENYFHVFPWVDLEYPVKSSFSFESDQIIKSALDLSELFS